MGKRKNLKPLNAELVEAVKEADWIVPHGGGELPIIADAKLRKLTDAERRLLVTLMNPIVAGKSVTEICELADISRDTYYRAYRDPLFIEMQNRLALAIIKQQVTPLIHTGLKAAHSGSFFHWKMLMEMASAYDAKRGGAGTALVPEGEQQEAEIVIRFASPNRVAADPDRLPFTDLDDPEEVAEMAEALGYEPDDE